MRRMSSMLESDGDSPPWTQKILDATTAAMGSVLKTSINVFQILMLTRRLHSSRRTRTRG